MHSCFSNQKTRVSSFLLHQTWECIILFHVSRCKWFFFWSADDNNFCCWNQPTSVISLLLSAEESLRCWQGQLAYLSYHAMNLGSGLRGHTVVFLKAGSETPPQRNHLPNNCRMFHVDSQLINHSACSTHKQVQQQLDSSGIKCCKRDQLSLDCLVSKSRP